MSSGTPVIEVTFRSVELRDETIWFVQRCCRQTLTSLPPRERRVHVLLERAWHSDQVHARVVVEDGAQTLGVHGRDLDELLAIQNAFASLHARLLGRMPRERGSAPRSGAPLLWAMLDAGAEALHA